MPLTPSELRCFSSRLRRPLWFALATFVVGIGYLGAYVALANASYAGTLSGFGIDLESMTATSNDRHFFVAQYGHAGRWSCLEVVFQPIHAFDRRLRPKTWERAQRIDVPFSVSH